MNFFYATPIKINLITTNDIHGVISEQKANFMNPQYPPTIIGGAALSKYLDELRVKIKTNKEGLLILDGGNFFQGSPLGMADSGRTMIKWMNRLNYDAIVPGSYDFINGAKNLNTLSNLSNFPFLFSNLSCKNCPLTSNNIKPYIIKNISGVKIGILGIVNSQLSNLVLSQNLSGSHANKELTKINNWITEMKNEGAKVIIVLTSSGVPWNREKEYDEFIDKVQLGEISKDSSLNALEMSYYLEGVDFIVSGGNSKGYSLPWYNPHSHIYVIQGYGRGTEFSHIKLLIDEKSHLFMGYETVIDNKASLTLLADDFTSNKKDYNWIKSKTDSSKFIYYNQKHSKAYTANIINELKKDKWNFPNLNKDNYIDIATWNCQFFPHANDSTILALAESILDFNLDIIAFQELRKTGWFSTLMSYLPNYSFIVSKQASFMDLAIIYKTDLFVLQKQIEPFCENDYNFAGRPPLQADLIYLENDINIPISIINLHMKCCDSGLSRRKKASSMLYEYLDLEYKKQPNIIVLGDWNDDTKDAPNQHCFQPFFNDDRFYFTTANIAFDLNQASYPKEPYVSFLDHIMVSEHLLPKNSNYNVNTILVGNYMGGYDMYENYISDHRPVLLSFSVTK